jgi:hypothetical protein
MSEAPAVSDCNDKTTQERTRGEELFLVHLSRFNKEKRSETDFDHETKEPRTRTMSAGEELWQVHLKRSAGLEQEGDEDKDNEPVVEKKKRTKVLKEASVKRDTGHVIHLRNRDVELRLA